MYRSKAKGKQKEKETEKEKQYKPENEKVLHAEDHGDSIRKWLHDELPMVTQSQVNAICDSVIPKAGQEIVQDLQWPEIEVEMVNKRADEISVTEGQPEGQHEDTANDSCAEVGVKLYKLCLRKWHRFPTEIICPSTGLVFISDQEKSPSPGKLIEMNWTRSFAEAMMTIIPHSAWGIDFYLMVYAIKFACICRYDDRRPWELETYGDPFFEAFRAYQQQKPNVAKVDLLNDIERQLKRDQEWPSRQFQIFKSIAGQVKLSSKKEGKLERFHLLPVRTSDISAMVKALDGTITEEGIPFLPADYQLRLFTFSREGQIYKSPDIPADKKSYEELRHAALKGLRANAIAYELAVVEEIVLQHVPRRARALPDAEEEVEEEDSDDAPILRKRPHSGKGHEVSYSSKRQRSRRGTTHDVEDEPQPTAPTALPSEAVASTSSGQSRVLPDVESNSADHIEDDTEFIGPLANDPFSDDGSRLPLPRPITVPPRPRRQERGGERMAIDSQDVTLTTVEPLASVSSQLLTPDVVAPPASISSRLLTPTTAEPPAAISSQVSTPAAVAPFAAISSQALTSATVKPFAAIGSQVSAPVALEPPAAISGQVSTPAPAPIRLDFGNERHRHRPAPDPYSLGDLSGNDEDTLANDGQENTITEHQEDAALNSAAPDLTGQDADPQDLETKNLDEYLAEEEY
ncbi:hypothetical protein GGR51DRAFT_575832 [Nemania sp. FL0031]|nr:hypothetical protein GGR51DRAFT_575832 [Nemania sp. FL0031]